MLQELHVKNFALIDDVEVEFHEGLNILSGETGAGKSIIMGSIAMALGAKTSKDYIRHGASYAYVEIAFSVDENAAKMLAELDIDTDENNLVISRKITENKSVCRINGETVSIGTLREAASCLIDIHGQQDTQILTKPSRQMEILDIYAGEDLAALLGEYRQVYRDYHKALDALNREEIDESTRLREIGYAEYVIREIEEAGLSEEEEEILAQQFQRLNYSKNLIEGMGEIQQNLFSDDGTGDVGGRIDAAMRTATHLLNTVGEDAKLSEIIDALYDIESMMNDLQHCVNAYSDSIENSDEEYAGVTARMDLIHTLKGKYGRTIPDILRFQQEQEARLEALQHYEEERAVNEQLLTDSVERMLELAGRIHNIRELTAGTLSVQISRVLGELNFLNAKFEICLKEAEEDVYFPDGRDRVTYMIAPNPGEPLKPLSQIASGGEMSRVMLALKTVLASADYVDTFIFDEIDAGISGRTAQMVGEKLMAISHEHQIICISHLPQIVSMADYHYLIEKYTRGEETKTEIIQLEYDDSVNEIARLLGGASITQTVLDSAWEMKDLAQKLKY